VAELVVGLGCEAEEYMLDGATVTTAVAWAGDCAFDLQLLSEAMTPIWNVTSGL
jgi:hypothetical protein